MALLLFFSLVPCIDTTCPAAPPPHQAELEFTPYIEMIEKEANGELKVARVREAGSSVRLETELTSCPHLSLHPPAAELRG